MGSSRSVDEGEDPLAQINESFIVQCLTTSIVGEFANRFAWRNAIQPLEFVVAKQNYLIDLRTLIVVL